MRIWITTALLVVGAAPAGAAPRPDGSDFSCRASAMRAVFPPYPGVQPPSLEPLIANAPGASCADAEAETTGAQAVGPLMIEALRAATDVTPNDLSTAPAAEGDSATATASVERVTIDAPIPITATGLRSDVSVTCKGGQPVPTHSGRVTSLFVAGVSIPVPDQDNVRIPGFWLGEMILNQVIEEPTKITRRALFVDFNGNTGLPVSTVAEATVGWKRNPCAATGAPLPNSPGAAVTPPAPPSESPTPTQVRPPARTRLTTTNARFIRSGAERCIRPRFTARVVGVNIDHVSFTLDGKAQRRKNSAPFQLRINTPALSPAIHRLTAHVVFRRQTGTSPRTLKFSFRRCADDVARR